GVGIDLEADRERGPGRHFGDRLVQPQDPAEERLAPERRVPKDPAPALEHRLSVRLRPAIDRVRRGERRRLISILRRAPRPCAPGPEREAERGHPDPENSPPMVHLALLSSPAAEPEGRRRQRTVACAKSLE